MKPQVIDDEEHERVYERVAAVDVAKEPGIPCANALAIIIRRCKMTVYFPWPCPESYRSPRYARLHRAGSKEQSQYT